MTRGLLLAVAFLTRIPVRLPADTGERDQGMAVAMYPLVGLGLGIALALPAAGAVALGLAAPPVAAILVALLAALTGALHLDGLADTADAWLGAHGDRERMLAIMKDPTCGPAGVVVIVLTLLGKVTAVAALLGEPAGWIGLLLAPLLARTGCALLFPLLPYVRPGGLGEPGARYLAEATLLVTVTGAVLIAVIVGGLTGIVMVAVAALVLAGAGRLMRRLLGGFTGDTAGALVEILEATTLLTAAVVLSGAH